MESTVHRASAIMRRSRQEIHARTALKAMTMNAPELLSPAGRLKNARFAYAYGADAVYAGQPRYSLRARNNDFSMENLRSGIEYAHGLGRKFFVASNVLPHDNKVKTYLRDMEPVVEMHPDALIMADPGLIMLVRERWPEIPIHLSVQANTLNAQAVRFWKSVGIERVILSRELSLDEIESIRQQCPDIEIEVFVHGALCIAYSGRCLLSGYFKHRDPNQGACTNSCRWKYGLQPASETQEGDIQTIAVGGCGEAHDSGPVEGVYLLEEAQRPGELMPIFEDEHGTYIMNSKDLRAVQHVARLARMGVDSLKIEGRTKSFFYAARTAQIYRRAIDDAIAGRDFDMDLMVALDGMANRGYTEGFYRRHVPDEYQNYESGASRSDSQRFVGEVTDNDGQWLTVEVKNRIRIGDALELMLPSGNRRFTLEHMQDLNGQAMDIAPGSNYIVQIPAPSDVTTDFGLLIADL